MATVTRKCPGCSRRFRVSAQSRRKFCEPCRPPRTPRAAGEESTPIEAAAPFVGEVGARVRKALGAIEDDDLQGQVAAALAIRLATLLDDPRLPGGQASSLARQIEDLTTKATRNVKPSADWVDDLTARRQA